MMLRGCAVIGIIGLAGSGLVYGVDAEVAATMAMAVILAVGSVFFATVIARLRAIRRHRRYQNAHD